MVQIGKELLGKHLFTSIRGEVTGGIITETESYRGAEDKACHAYGNRKTARTAVMFEPGGIAYVYLCYGMHHLFNIVTHGEGTPHAILIRAIQPTHGLETMARRRKKKRSDPALCKGPGNLTKALGIETSHTGTSLAEGPIWLEDHGITFDSILTTPRIGIDYAEEDKDLPYRFVVA